jgi:hypothetical protein
MVGRLIVLMSLPLLPLLLTMFPLAELIDRAVGMLL